MRIEDMAFVGAIIGGLLFLLGLVLAIASLEPAGIVLITLGVLVALAGVSLANA